MHETCKMQWETGLSLFCQCIFVVYVKFNPLLEKCSKRIAIRSTWIHFKWNGTHKLFECLLGGRCLSFRRGEIVLFFIFSFFVSLFRMEEELLAHWIRQTNHSIESICVKQPLPRCIWIILCNSICVERRRDANMKPTNGVYFIPSQAKPSQVIQRVSYGDIYAVELESRASSLTYHALIAFSDSAERWHEKVQKWTEQSVRNRLMWTMQCASALDNHNSQEKLFQATDSALECMLIMRTFWVKRIIPAKFDPT